MSAASEARDRLAAAAGATGCDLKRVHLSGMPHDWCFTHQRSGPCIAGPVATLIADRLAEGDAAVTAVAVLTADLAIWRARAEKAEAEGAAAVAERDRLREVVARVEAYAEHMASWLKFESDPTVAVEGVAFMLRRALDGPAPAADHESGAGDERVRLADREPYRGGP